MGPKAAPGGTRSDGWNHGRRNGAKTDLDGWAVPSHDAGNGEVREADRRTTQAAWRCGGWAKAAGRASRVVRVDVKTRRATDHVSHSDQFECGRRPILSIAQG